MADRIKNYQQEADQITTLKAIRTDFGVTPSSYTPDATVVTKDRVVTFAQAEEELVVLGDIEKGVKQQVAKGDIADKRITNIEKLLQGNLYDYQTDSTSAYTKTVPSGAMPYAGLEKVGGKTVVWNQLVDSGTTSVATISGHKYYTLIDGTASIVTADGTAITIVDDSADMVCDLTLMFGSGNEPSTTSDFTAIFGATHYSYNAGELLSAGVTEVESVGVNRLNPAEVVQGSISGTGEDSSSTIRLRTSLIKVKPSTTFTIRCKTGDPDASDKLVVMEVNKFKQNGEWIGYSTIDSFLTNQTFGADVYYIKVLFRKFDNSTILPSELQEPMVAEGSSVAYVPYVGQIYPIPAEIRALEGYGWSAGSVYNEVDFERKVFIQRVASVNLGTLSWTKSGWRVYNSPILENIKHAATDSTLANIVCDSFVSRTLNNIVNIHLDGIAVSDSGRISVGIGTDDSTALDNLITSLSGKILYYELATPVEVDISQYLTDDNLIQVESGGTLTFPNSNGTDYQIPVPSEEEYMIDLQEAINNG